MMVGIYRHGGRVETLNPKKRHSVHMGKPQTPRTPSLNLILKTRAGISIFNLVFGPLKISPIMHPVGLCVERGLLQHCCGSRHLQATVYLYNDGANYSPDVQECCSR